ncbi:hypothetical protein BLNAU_18915 [Blattamonas nauphoetae]|uniref:Uncharacterized protein n=1 Tax=Blattamonas nauphoetae TaxID=2049346 RepID=A0ABQ9X331_9EUKA|nr:hypothetical protein BLNAU_18915 [Blattamonas nauphoetae]
MLLFICHILLCHHVQWQSLAKLLDKESYSRYSNDQAVSQKLLIPGGHFHVASYKISSSTLILEGNNETELHIEADKSKRTSLSTSETENKDFLAQTSHTMFILLNSTASLSHMSFDCSAMNSSLATLKWSSVTIGQSQILSNVRCSPLIVENTGEGGESCVVIDGCSHWSSTSPSLLPFVSFARSLSSPSNGQHASFGLDCVCISGCGLSLSNTNLVLGSGPLFDFGRIGSDNATLRTISSTLSASSLTNTTSPSPSHRSASAFRGGWNQRVCGSCVMKSTNHLYGTTIIDMNRGGSLLSHNTSFTECHTPSRPSPNTQYDYDGMHFDSRIELFGDQFLTDVFSLCTFDGCESAYTGGAIDCDASDINVQVKQCSFRSCRADRQGGALWFYCPGDSAALLVFESIFSNCLAANDGGDLHIKQTYSLTISDCFFIDSSATEGSGGSISLASIRSYSTNIVSNCLFENCRTEEGSDQYYQGGGAVYMSFVGGDVQLTYLQFRGCSASSKTGHDIYVKCTTFNTRKFTYSETTVPGWNRLVTGDVLIVLSNEDSTRTPVSGQAPNIGRVLKFTFSDTDTSTFTGPVGETKLFQGDLSDYKIVNGYLNGHLFSDKYVKSASCDLDSSGMAVDISFAGLKIPSGAYTITLNDKIPLSVTFTLDESGESAGTVKASIGKMEDELKENVMYAVTSVTSQDEPNTLIAPGGRFTVPGAAPILEASCRVGSETNHAWIQLTGLNIAAGTYSVTLKDEEFSFQVTFTDQKDENGQKQSSQESVRLFGDGSKLTFDTEYTLESVTDSALNAVDLLGMIIKFRTPHATDRIVGIGTMNFTGNQKDEVSVSLSGADLASTEYFITTSPPSDLNGNKMSVVFIDQSGTLVGKVYSATGNAVPLDFGTTYEILSMTDTADRDILFVDTLTFDVPTEPARIESTSAVLNGAKTSVTVTLTGRRLFSATMSVTVKNPISNRAFVTNLMFVDSTSCTVLFAAAQTESGATVMFGVSYDIVSIESSDGKKSFVVNTGVKVSVPSAPIIDTITSTLSPNCTHFEIVFGGTSLPSIGSFVASISPSISLALSYENGKWTTGWLSNVEIGMLMNTSYSVTKIPAVTLKDDDLNSVVVSLDGLRMPVSSVVMSFDLIVVESGKESEIRIAVSFSSNSVGSGEVEVYKSGKLKYSTSYSVVRMTSAVVSVSIPSSVTFTTPSHPTRIISATCDLDTETGKTAEIVLNGVSFPQSTPFTLTVFELDDSKVRTGNAIELSSSFTSDGSSTSHTLSSLIFGNYESKLKYGKSYEITKLEIANMKMIVDDLACFLVPPEPARLMITLLNVDVGMNFSTLTLTTRQLIPNEKYTVALSGTPITRSNSDSVHTLDFEVDGAASITTVLSLYPVATLRFNHLYEVTSMKLKSSSAPIFMESEACSFSTPAEPTRIVDGYGRLNWQRTEVVVTLTGLALKAGSYSFTLTHPIAANSRIITGNLNSDELVKCSHTVEASNANHLMFGETYTITSATLNTHPILFDSDIHIRIPDPPVVTYASFSFTDSRNTTCTVTLTGSDLDLQGNYLVALSDGPTLTIFFNDSTHAVSPVLLIGLPGTLQSSTSYTIVSIKRVDDETDVVLVDGPVTFETGISRMPKVTEAIVRPNAHNTAVTIELSGTDLALMKEYTVTLRPSFSFVVLFADASRAISPTLRIGTSDGLEANTEYFVESIVGVMNMDDIIFIVGLISFTTPEATLMEMVVSSSFEGREGEECGSLSLPCETLLIGWEMGKKGGGIEKIVLRVRDSAESGGVVVVGRGSVEVRGMFGEKGRILISEQATASTKSESVLLVDGGEILLLDLFVSVPSFTSVWGWRPGFVVGGEGTVIVKGVEIVCEEGGKGGMGLVGLEQGRLEVDHLFIRNIAFSEGVGLIRCLGGHNELSTDINNLVVQNSTLSEGGIVAFSSTEITSELSMTDSEIHQVRMSVGDGTDKPLVSIRTQQTRLTISKCVFFESGCEHASGVKIGQTLLVTLHSSDKDETVQRVDLHSCLFVDCAGGDESGEGGVVIRSGEGLSRVSLSGSWFEERSGSLSPSSFERDADGRVVVTKRRMWFVGWKRGGVVVERGRRLPVIDRKGSGFSNCGLIVREKEVERGNNIIEMKNDL